MGGYSVRHWELHVCSIHATSLTTCMPRLSSIARARAIGQLENGASQTAVAARFGVSQATISKLRRRFHDTNDVKDRPRSGRPRVTTAATDRRIETLAARRRFVVSTVIQQEVQQPGRPRVSRSTIRRRLHNAGLRSRRPATVPDMTPDHERIRLAWCRHRRRWNQIQWGNILFSDESRFCLKKNDGRVRVWRRRGERHARACVQAKKAFHGGSVMVWAGITARGKTPLVIVNGNLNAQVYIDQILRPVVVPFIANMEQGAVLQDDNARPHRARVVDTFLQQQQITRMDWPACSPDLNPIEHMWDQLGRAVRLRLTVHSTMADLRRFLLEEWDRIPMNNVQRLVHSMRRRCIACIAAEGGPTAY